MNHLFRIFLDFKLIILFFLLSNQMAYGLQSESGDRIGLSQILKHALKNNPKTQANDLMLEAQLIDVEASRLRSIYPSVSLNKSYYSTQRHFNGISYAGRELISSVGISLNLFRGFQDYNRLKYEKCSYDFQVSEYNSSNAFIPNTKGQIASSVTKQYLNVAAYREAIEFNRLKISIFESIKPYAKRPEDIKRVENAIFYDKEIEYYRYKNLEIGAMELLASEAALDEVPQLLNLFATVQSVEIPEDIDESISIGLLKSPEIVSAKIAIECAQNMKDLKNSEMYGPTVGVTLSRDHTRDLMSGERSKDNKVTFIISKPFDLSGMSAFRASDSRLKVAYKDLDSAENDLRANLAIYYMNMKGLYADFENNQIAYDKHLQEIEILIKDLQNQTQAQASEGTIQLIADTVSLLHRRWSAKTNSLIRIIDTKFNVQRITGVLFESLERISESNEQTSLEKNN